MNPSKNTNQRQKKSFEPPKTVCKFFSDDRWFNREVCTLKRDLYNLNYNDGDKVKYTEHELINIAKKIDDSY